LEPATTQAHESEGENGEAVSDTVQRVAIVTGGSQGIGAGLVEGYRQQGWAVVTNARSIKPSDDPDVLAVAGDISEPATADEIISQAMGRFGRVDTLINNAGIFISKPFTDHTAEDYALVTGVNLAGFFWMTQRAIGQMLKQHRGHIVNISASVAEFVDSAEPTALAALTKGGLTAVTKSLAIEYASRGIRVNAVAPGIIETPLLPPESFTPEALAGKLPPLGRVGQVSDVVGGILYLESAPYVTGEVLHIDAGRTVGH
jgi:NAD(P)-dependent dehydrogenase (short-subunit alcohol dehydrogenase family)